jgi:site-specific recombinase XerC
MPATFNNRLIYLRTFLNYCVEQDRLVTNPIGNIKSKKTEGKVVAVEMDILRALLRKNKFPLIQKQRKSI